MQLETTQENPDATAGVERPSHDARSGRWLAIGLASLLFAATALAYVQVWDAEFVGLDDARHIAENPNVNPPSWQGLVRIWTDHDYYGIYVPVAYTFYAVEARVAQWWGYWSGQAARSDSEPTDASGADEPPRPVAEQPVDVPWVYHVGNVLLHATCVVLVFAVLNQLVRDQVAAALGGFLFAIHPLQIESAAWVSETRGTLAGVFCFAAIYAYIRYTRPRGFNGPVELDNTGSDGDSRAQERSVRRWLWYVGASLAYLLALLSKPSSVSVPLILAAIDFGWFRRAPGKTALALGWWLAPAAALAWRTSEAQRHAIENFPFHVAWWQRPLVAVDSLDFYFLKLVAPFRLTVDYGRSPPVALGGWTVFVAWALPVALLFVLWRLPHRRVWLTAAGIFVAGVAPVLGFLSFGFQEMSTVGDRYVYLSMLGPALALAWLVEHVLRRAFRLEIALALAALAGYTAWYSGYWQNTRRLFEHTLEINPESHTAYNAIAVTYIGAEDYVTAEKYLRQATDIAPNNPTVLTNLGVVHTGRGRLDDAEAAYRAAIAADPSFAVPQLYLGGLYMDRQEWDRAIEVLARLVAQQPDAVQARLYLGRALAGSGRLEESIEHWEAVLEAMPNHVDAHARLGAVLVRLGRLDEGRRHFEIILEINPHESTAKKALEQLDRTSRGPSSVR